MYLQTRAVICPGPADQPEEVEERTLQVHVWLRTIDRTHLCGVCSIQDAACRWCLRKNPWNQWQLSSFFFFFLFKEEKMELKVEVQWEHILYLLRIIRSETQYFLHVQF